MHPRSTTAAASAAIASAGPISDQAFKAAVTNPLSATAPAAGAASAAAPISAPSAASSRAETKKASRMPGVEADSSGKAPAVPAMHADGALLAAGELCYWTHV